MAVTVSLPSLCHPQITSLHAAPRPQAEQWQTGRQRTPFRIILFIFAKGQVPLVPVLWENPAWVRAGFRRLESPEEVESSPGRVPEVHAPSP